MSEIKTRTPKQIEKYFKGVANHRRIEILLLIEQSGGICLERIADVLKYEIKNKAPRVGRRRALNALEMKRVYCFSSVTSRSIKMLY